MADQAYQSLYRRYRPQRFDEVLGQGHVTRALRNSVRESRISHAYLFSGPRGTGKTSTARILAKALNCEAPGDDGEPCGVCASCVAVAAGTSLDVHELDAASNNGVEAMRDLAARTALATPGRWKVYIVDEVHMLSTAASNALLKTLEEPPSHVTFVLATTDPQKLLPTIRSRAQHFEFHLLGRDVLAGLLGSVREDAGLEIASEALDVAVRKGGGSARDALSALDQLAAGGEVDDDLPVLDELVEATCARDGGRALLAVAGAVEAGRDPERLASDLVEHLRQGFLALMAPSLVALEKAAADKVADQARRLGPAALVRAMEVLGRSQVDMRDALDSRVALEVALVRMTTAEADPSAAALAERVERLERRLATAPTEATRPAAGTRTAAGPSAAAGASTAGASTAGPSTAGPSAAGGEASSGGRSPTQPRPEAVPLPERPALGALLQSRNRAADPGPSRPGPGPGAAPASIPASPAGEVPTGEVPTGEVPTGEVPTGERPTGEVPTGGPPTSAAPTGESATAELPSRDELVKAWGDGVLAGLSNRARARFKAGRFLEATGGRARFVLPDEVHRSYSEVCQEEVQAALSAHFGTRIRLELGVDPEQTLPEPGGPGRPSTPASAGTAGTAGASGPGAGRPRAGRAGGSPDGASPSPVGAGRPEEGADLPGEEAIDLDDLRDAPSGVASAEEHLLRVFPGAEEV